MQGHLSGGQYTKRWLAETGLVLIVCLFKIISEGCVNVNRTLQTIDIGVTAFSKAMSPRPDLCKGFRMVLTVQFFSLDFRKEHAWSGWQRIL